MFATATRSSLRARSARTLLRSEGPRPKPAVDSANQTNGANKQSSGPSGTTILLIIAAAGGGYWWMTSKKTEGTKEN
ncbi:uncharacterized protein VTP21DRAFT_8442 [Calcarisporiella thermophila]|uniref:uncharacterized protein n=1 Tax=Calcarisporiella thermophila TaxID=911321 RepID=UPI003742CA78